MPAGLTAPDRTRVLGSSTCSPINPERPVCSANSSTGTNPAADTRFRSSNTADPTVNVYDECTENAFQNSGQTRPQPPQLCPGQKAFSLFTRRSNHRAIHGFRLSPPPCPTASCSWRPLERRSRPHWRCSTPMLRLAPKRTGQRFWLADSRARDVLPWWTQTNTGTPEALGTGCSSRPPEVPVHVRWDYFSRSRAALV